MSDLTLPTFEPARRWRFDWMLPALFRPRRTFSRIVSNEAAVWQTPIALLTLSTLIHTLVAGGIKQAAAASGQITLPPGFEYYTPEQQAQFQQAMAATSGPVFAYLLPSVTSVLGVIIGWLFVGWLLHLVLTLLGGRGSSRQVLNVVAWASLPFVLRDVVRIVAMWSSGQLIGHPGLSGFAPADAGNLSVYLAALLAMADLYLLWHLLLLGIGVSVGDTLSKAKAWTAVLVTVVAIYLMRALPALIAGQFNDITVIRPFF